MHKLKILPLLTAALLLTGCNTRYEYAPQQTYDNTDYTRESAGIRPQDDYYGYQNFDFLWKGDIPADMYEYSYGQIVSRQIDDILTSEIKDIAYSGEEYPIGSDEQKIRDLFLQHLDTDSRNSVGLAPLEKGLCAFDNAQSIDEFVQACGMVYRGYGCAVLPSPYYSQDHYDNSKYSVFVGQMELFYSADELLNSKNGADELQQSIALVLEVLEYENCDTLAYDIVTILLNIAESTTDLDEMRIDELYNVLTVQELGELFSNVNTDMMLDSFGTAGIESLVILDPAQMLQINALLSNGNLTVWKAFAKCSLIYAYKDYLPPMYSDALKIGDHRTDEEKAVGAVKQLLAGEVGNIYAEKYADKDTISAVTDMVIDIKTAYRDCIEGSDQLSENDRAECLAKIDNMTMNIGFPAEDYHSDSDVSGGLLESVISINSTLVDENLALADSPPSPSDWSMTPQAFNAIYQPQSNSITVPLAVFNAPFFDTEADYYTNLGGLGSVIAHEIGHAFDAEGILYDEHGNYRPERIGSERTDLLMSAIEEYFGSQMIMGTFYIDGSRTVLENAADLGGMQVIASMTDEPEELRRIFESYANIWATLSYDTDAIDLLADDVHSPAEVRVNAVLSSVDGFYKAYDINENDGMYIPADKRVRLW